ncbi:MAG: BMC domain-containing protein [Planctomycetota bacterium]|nr:MAG: BMC domain-containing protein [Planctomycetota bacterium]
MKIPYSPSQAQPCIGGVETSSIPQGVLVADAMLKKAPVEMLLSTPTSPGYYLNLITGEVENVRSSLEEAQELTQNHLRSTLFLPDVHPQVLRSLFSISPPQSWEAVGVLETRTQLGILEAADKAVKWADVELVHIHLGVGIGGKAFLLLTGAYEEVEEALQQAQTCLESKQEEILDLVLIGNADPALIPALMQNPLPQRREETKGPFR